jgi:RNA recognition motif-containing protein
MAMRIYVGNLPYTATNEQLTHLFAAFGDVTEAVVVLDRVSGQSKGFGFVEMADSTAARTAIAELNGTMLDDRAIRVSEAQARPERPGGSGGRPQRGPDDRDRRW